MAWSKTKFAVDIDSLCIFGSSLCLRGYFALREAVEKLLKDKFQIDFLMLIAAAGAAFLGEWAEEAFLLFLFAIGHALEHFAMTRARNAISALSDLTPDDALVRRGEKTETLSIQDLAIGDVIIFRRCS